MFLLLQPFCALFAILFLRSLALFCWPLYSSQCIYPVLRLVKGAVKGISVPSAVLSCHRFIDQIGPRVPKILTFQLSCRLHARGKRATFSPEV